MDKEYYDIDDEDDTNTGIKSLANANLQDWGLNEFRNWVHNYVRARMLDDEDNSVLIIPPGLGKSYSAKEEIAQSAECTPYFYATHTYENREERAKELRKLNPNITVICLPPTKYCPIYANEEEYQDEASKLLRALVTAGLSLKQAHRIVGDALPDHVDGHCPYTDEDPTEEEKDEADVLIGSHHHARAQENVEGRRVILDEFTGGADAHTVEFGYKTERPIPETITAVIESCEQSNIDSWREFITTSLHTDEMDQEVAELLAYLGEISGSDLRIRNPIEYMDEGATVFPHVKTPKLLYTVATTEPEQLGDALRYETNGAIVVVERDEDAQDTVLFVEKSQLTDIAKSVTALDGMDKLGRWNLYYGLNKKKPFTGGDVATYLDVAFDDLRLLMPSDRDSPGPRPYNGRYVTPTQDGGMIRLIMDKHGSDLGIITTNNAFEKYEEKSDPDVQIIPGLESDLTDSDYTMHYGTIRSNRDFEDFDIVAIIGSNYPPDPVIRRECILRGIMPEIDHDADVSYQGRTGEIRDAMLEEDTMQALMRARKSDPSDDGSIVYVYTDTVPEEYESGFDTWLFDSNLLNSRSRLNAFDMIRRLDLKDLIQHDNEDDDICDPIVGNSLLEILNDITYNEYTSFRFTQSRIADEGIATRRTINNTMRHFQEKGIVEKVKESQGPHPAIWAYCGVDAVLRKSRDEWHPPVEEVQRRRRKTIGELYREAFDKAKERGEVDIARNVSKPGPSDYRPPDHPSIEEVHEMKETEDTTPDPEDFDSKEEYLLAQGACPSIEASMM